MYKRRIGYGVIICVLITFLFITQSQNIHTEESQRLMIVAHPDDETIFGGNELSKHPYFVICITNGDNKKRREEFEEVLKKTNNDGVILSFPDKVDGKRSNWSQNYDEICDIVTSYINEKDWDRIITHNPDGEYGHIQHILTSRIVTKVIETNHKENLLYYFRPYFKKDATPPPNKTMNVREENQKKDLATIYTSQKKVIKKLIHTFGYEEFISYADKDTYFKK